MMAYQIGRDVIVTRRQRLELAETRDRLAQVERVSLMGQLASSLSHELSQPLTATDANVQAGLMLLSAEKPDSEELRTILDDIGSDHRRAAEIIDRMRRFFKQRKIEMQALSVEEVVREAAALVRSEMNAKSVALSVVIEPGLPRVYGDRVHLSQVLLNLFMNSISALRSCSRDGRRIVVEARVIHGTSEVEIAVQDSGPGIPAAAVDQLFKPFFTTKSDGTGIGLALSRTIIEAHGGHLRFDENGRDGATFRFTLRQAASAGYSADKIILVSQTREGVVRQAPA
jgi:signal transduction histidine kinase